MELRRTDEWDKFYPIRLSVIIDSRVTLNDIFSRRFSSTTASTSTSTLEYRLPTIDHPRPSSTIAFIHSTAAAAAAVSINSNREREP